MAEDTREDGATARADVADDARAALSAVGAKVGEGMRRGAAGVSSSAARARAAVDAEDARWDARERAADLPEIDREAPLAALAVRLDRRADHYRALATELLRPDALRWLLVASLAGGVLFVLAGALALLLRLVVGGTPEPAVAVSLLAVPLATAILAATIARIDRGRREAARELLALSEEAERRLVDVTRWMVIERVDPRALVDARVEEPMR